MPLSAGARLGPYEILAAIGAGGMGEVYKARDTRLDRTVAIKVLPLEVSADPDRRVRFEREAKTIAGLNHPHICTLYDVGEHDGSTFLVMEHLAGETLAARLQRGPLPLAQTLTVATEITDALAAAHRQGVVHRDLKPGNVMLTKSAAKLLDFGLAKVFPLPGEGGAASTLDRTSDGVLLGTLAYMAPEQLEGKPADARSDIFALGLVLYEMAAGRHPFGGQHAAAMMVALMRQMPAPLHEQNPGVPVELDRLIARCLEKDPTRRPASAAEIRSALDEIRQKGQKATGVVTNSEAQAAPSVAVLSFADMSPGRDQEYFCDGIAEEIINALAHIDGLQVTARTSSFALKSKLEDVREIGRRLGVAAVLEGSVRKAGERLRITVQLINVTDGYHLWSERFDRRLEDVFAIQDEIALAIVDTLKVTLLSGEKPSVVSRPLADLAAYDAYLKGLFEWNTMTPEGFARCQELYRQAIRLDPGFAPPYAQLADSCTSATWWADQPPSEALAHALPLVEQALALDPNLSHAHSVMGHALAFFERNRTGGERSLRRAVELAPNNALAQTYLGLLLMMQGCGDEAVARARLALRLDPLSPAIGSWAAAVLFFSGCQGEALAILEKQVAGTPHLWMPHYFLGQALAVLGRLAEARAESEKAVDLSGANSLTLSLLICVRHLLGDPERPDDLFARLQRRAVAAYVGPMFLAWAHLARGEADAALSRVEAALAAKDPWVMAHRLYSPAIVPAEPRVDALIAASFS